MVDLPASGPPMIAVVVPCSGDEGDIPESLFLGTRVGETYTVEDDPSLRIGEKEPDAHPW